MTRFFAQFWKDYHIVVSIVTGTASTIVAVATIWTHLHIPTIITSRDIEPLRNVAFDTIDTRLAELSSDQRDVEDKLDARPNAEFRALLQTQLQRIQEQKQKYLDMRDSLK